MKQQAGKIITVAIAVCLAYGAVAQSKPAPSVVDAGKSVFEMNCLACHQADGSGVPQLTPPLINSAFVQGDKTRLIGIILKGLKDTEINGEMYDNPMPPFEHLTDEEIALVLTYVRSNFSNKGSAIQSEDVTQARKAAAAK